MKSTNISLLELPSTSEVHNAVRIELRLERLQQGQVVAEDSVLRRAIDSVVAVQRRIRDVLSLADCDLRDLLGALHDSVPDGIVAGGERPGVVEVERKEGLRTRRWVGSRLGGPLGEDAGEEGLDIVREESGGRKAKTRSQDLGNNVTTLSKGKGYDKGDSRVLFIPLFR